MTKEKALQMAEREVKRSQINLETEMKRANLPQEMYDNLVAKVQYAELVCDLVSKYYEEGQYEA